MPTPYDVVYHWIRNGAASHWAAIEAPDQDALDIALERAELIEGHVAHRGMLSIGAPEGAPSDAERTFAYNRSQKALTAAFELVHDPDDWKAPIDVSVSHREVDRIGGRRLLEAAIIHFTATVADISTGGSGIRVEAEGYRMGPAGDH